MSAERLRSIDARVVAGVDGALDLIAAVREGRPSDVVAALNTRDLHVVALVLAQMADDDKHDPELHGRTYYLLRWARLPRGVRRPLQPCGTHAAYVRHAKRGEPADHECVLAEREYQRLRKRRARAVTA